MALDLNALKVDDVTDEVDDDRDLEGGGGLHVEFGYVAGVGQTRLGGVTQTVTYKNNNNNNSNYNNNNNSHHSKLSDPRSHQLHTHGSR